MTDQSPKKKVLCIEDEQFIADLYARALHNANYEVDVVADGKEALDVALSDKYDIILLDIMIPQVLGLDILRKLRERQPAIKAKIIISTNLEQGEAERHAVEQEADGYLIKAEITPSQLVEYLNQL